MKIQATLKYYDSTRTEDITFKTKGATELDQPVYDITKSLYSIAIPDTVTGIGEKVFVRCEKLTEITIPASVTRIGGEAFYRCNNLTKVNYLGDIESWCKIDFEDFFANPLDNDKAYLYVDGKAVTKISLPTTVTEIKPYSLFYKNLESVSIPNSVTRIGKMAFCDSEKFNEITLPVSIKCFDDSAFYWCKHLKKIHYTGTIQDWCNIEFANDSASPLYHGANLYINNEIVKKVVIPSTVTEIKPFAFSNSSITSITIPDSVTKIGRGAFEKCSKLKAVFYEGSIESWCKIDFDGSFANPATNPKAKLYINGKRVKNVVIPSTVTEIKPYTFDSCKLTSVTLPDTVTSIGEMAFAHCKFTKFTLPNNLISIGKQAFRCCKVAKFTMPNSITSIGDAAFAYCDATTVILPNNLTSISNSAFAHCEKLKGIVIPDSVTTIEDKAFCGCKALQKITVPENIVAVGKHAFSECSNLTTVYWNATACAKAGYLEFDDTSGLEYSWEDTPFIKCAKLETVIVGDNVTSIPKNTFYECNNLTNVTIGKSIASIGNYAFDRCSNIKKVYYTGDPQDWNNIKFGYDGNPVKQGAELVFVNKSN